jgi:hypothetical protein
LFSFKQSISRFGISMGASAEKYHFPSISTIPNNG